MTETVHLMSVFSGQPGERHAPRRGAFSARGRGRRTAAVLDGVGARWLRASMTGPLARGDSTPAVGEPRLSVGFHTVGQRCVLVLRGQLVSSSIAALEAQIDQLGCAPFEQVVLDVSNVTTIDATGKAVLVGLNHYVEARGGRMTIVGAGYNTAKVFANTPLAALILP